MKDTKAKDHAVMLATKAKEAFAKIDASPAAPADKKAAKAAYVRVMRKIARSRLG